jgi:hypothetical protein
MNLQKIFQKETFLLTIHCTEMQLHKYEEMGLIQYNKNGGDIYDRVRISRKGKTLLSNLEKGEFSSEIAELCDKIINDYEVAEKHVGNRLEVQNRLTWFIYNTGFSTKVVGDAVEEYLIDNSEYTLSLENLLWKPPSKAFSVHMNLKDSKLYDILCNKYKLNHNFFTADKKFDRSTQWLFEVSKLKVPKKLQPEFYITGSFESDNNALNKLKGMFFNQMKGKVNV